MRALHWLKTSNILYADIHIEDGNITCDDNDNNNDNNDNNDEDDDENNDDNDDNTITNEEDDEQQQQHEGTVNGPPQLESSVVRADFNMPNTEAVDIIRNGDFNYPVIDYHVLKASLLVCLLMLKQRKWHFPVCFQMVSMVS